MAVVRNNIIFCIKRLKILKLDKLIRSSKQPANLKINNNNVGLSQIGKKLFRNKFIYLFLININDSIAIDVIIKLFI